VSDLSEELTQRVSDIGTTQWSGTTYRHTAARRDPLSGEGARMFGGRWNPPESFPALYLASPSAACAAELSRMALSQGVEVDDLLEAKRMFHTIGVRDLAVLDLRERPAQEQVGLEPGDLSGDDWSACQAVGAAAHFLNFQGILAPSATGVGHVLTAFELRAGPDQLICSSSEPFTVDLYKKLTS
jgi:RES domain-containing protein